MFLYPSRLTLDQIHDLVIEESDDESEIFAIEPPIENANADTDCDSDCTDDEVTCNPDHLPRRILLSNTVHLSEQVTTDEIGSKSLQPSTSKRRRKETTIWHKDITNVDDPVIDYEGLSSDDSNEEDEENILKQIEHYWTNEWLDYVCEQSKLYAEQKSMQHDCVSRNNLRVFFGILILSGYNKLANRRLYWTQMPDVQNLLVVNSMRRDTFDQIMRCLHFTDNMNINEDRFYKVRPIFEHLNKTAKINKAEEFLSVDEIMVPYYGRHRDKQFIRGKPVRFGFKLWGAAKSDGTLLHVEPYCGSNTRIADHELGHGPNVIMEMIQQTNLRAGQHVICDNYFGSVALMKKLASKGIAITTTLREDRLEKAPLQPRKLMDKKPRGHMEEAFSGPVSIVKWKDNKVVSVGSNKLRAHPIQKAKRWDRKARKAIEIPVPNSIHMYNKNMGGIDLFDQQVAAYRIRIRSKKWWWPLFAWSLNAQVVNAWMKYRKNNKGVSLLVFTRQLVVALLTSYGTKRQHPGPTSVPCKSTIDEIRYNKQQHWPVKGESKYGRCRECGRRSAYICEMCNLPLHPECMKAFHTKN